MATDLVQNMSGLDVSKITDYLYLSAWPKGEHAELIQSLNVRLILSMNWRRPSKLLMRAPLRLLWLPTFDTPFTPIPMSVLRRGVEAALPVIRDGWSVLAHCQYGIHRSAAMAACVLVGMGYSMDGAMRLIKEHRPIADPYIWYIRRRIELFARYWSEAPEARLTDVK